MTVASRAICYYGKSMTMLADDSPILIKTKELCAAIAADPMFSQLQDRIECFLDDEAARSQYKAVHELGESLHQKQHAGLEPGPTEIKTFEAARDALFDNTVACDFMNAQRELEMLQKQIGKFLGMTFELGHVPTEQELADAEGGCCGGGGGGCCQDSDDHGHGHGHGGCCQDGDDHGHGHGGCGCH